MLIYNKGEKQLKINEKFSVLFLKCILSFYQSLNIKKKYVIIVGQI